jgi:hypothetical protein
LPLSSSMCKATEANEGPGSCLSQRLGPTGTSAGQGRDQARPRKAANPRRWTAMRGNTEALTTTTSPHHFTRKGRPGEAGAQNRESPGEARRPSWSPIEQNAAVWQGIRRIERPCSRRLLAMACVLKPLKCWRAQASRATDVFFGSVLPTRLPNADSARRRRLFLSPLHFDARPFSKNNTRLQPTARGPSRAVLLRTVTAA